MSGNPACPRCGASSQWNGTAGSTERGSFDVWLCSSGHRFETPIR